MVEKINQRVKLTKRLLKDTLIEILKTKSIYKVSIRELCEKAGINRSTFYKYYGNQFDLLTEMEEDMLALSIKALSTPTNNVFQSLCEIFCYLEENLELGRLLINNNVDPQFPKKFFSLPPVQQEINRVLGSNYSETEYKYLSCFLTYGSYQIIRMWINKENRETPEEMAALILNQIVRMVQGYRKE